MTDERGFDEDDLRSLGEKLAALDLTDRERAAMASLLADEDVSGFGTGFDVIGGIRKGYIAPRDIPDWFTKGGPHGLQADESGPASEGDPGPF